MGAIARTKKPEVGREKARIHTVALRYRCGDGRRLGGEKKEFSVETRWVHQQMGSDGVYEHRAGARHSDSHSWPAEIANACCSSKIQEPPR